LTGGNSDRTKSNKSLRCVPHLRETPAHTRGGEVSGRYRKRRSLGSSKKGTQRPKKKKKKKKKSLHVSRGSRRVEIVECEKKKTEFGGEGQKTLWEVAEDEDLTFDEEG